MNIAVIIAIVVVVLIVLWAVGAYNGLVSLRNRVKNAWSQIDVQLRRRYDLIPNLVETAKQQGGPGRRRSEHRTGPAHPGGERPFPRHL